jgi:ribose transport system substrate-binding protein
MLSLLDGRPEIQGVFAVWDVPAMAAVNALKARSIALPMTTIDLGHEAAMELAAGGLVKGIGAQQPYDQGLAAGVATIIALLGRQPPPWVALPGLAVEPQNMLAAYQLVWHAPAPPAILKARKAASAG